MISPMLYTPSSAAGIRRPSSAMSICASRNETPLDAITHFPIE